MCVRERLGHVGLCLIEKEKSGEKAEQKLGSGGVKEKQDT